MAYVDFPTDLKGQKDRKAFWLSAEGLTLIAGWRRNGVAQDALYRRAVGYDYWEEVYDLIEGELRLSRKLKKHMPPDTKAIMQWLFNRLPLQWRALQEPLQDTQYTGTIKNILVAMKEVAESGDAQTVDVKEEKSEE